MSATIWDEEVCNGLREEIFDSVRFRNREGFMSHLDYEAITVRDPEREFKEEDMPCVSIYVRTHDFAKDRYYPVQNVISRDFENNTMVVEDASLPYNLSLQIDFWANYQSDIDSMMQSWLAKHFHDFNLKIKDTGDNSRTCNCLQKGEIVRADLVKNGKRLFHSSIIYQIWVEINEEMQYNKHMVGRFNINE